MPVKPVVLRDAPIPDLFDTYDPITPLLYVEDLGYNNENVILFFSKEYLLKEASDFYVIRQVSKI